jgi:hypothetical protein
MTRSGQDHLSELPSPVCTNEVEFSARSISLTLVTALDGVRMVTAPNRYIRQLPVVCVPKSPPIPSSTLTDDDGH